MPTNDERREVAARLRETILTEGAAVIEKSEGLDAAVAARFVAIPNLVAALNFDKAIVSMQELTDSLADLIEPEPERTCKFVADVMITAWDEDDNEIETGEVADEADMSCDNCDYPMMRDECIGWWDEEKGPYGGWLLTPRFNYCPKCGYRVVDWDGKKVVS